MSRSDRAKAVVAHFPAIPERLRPELDDVITRAINRALDQQLTRLEYDARTTAWRAEGRARA